MPGSPNIIVFGQTGAGKSSLINMLAGEMKVQVGSGPIGCTSKSEGIQLSKDPRDEATYTFWDTPGLNESHGANQRTEKAMDELCRLVEHLQSFNLIIYCVSGSRFTEIVQVNYDLFYGIVCQKKVPIILVVTGLEQEDDMDNWLTNNRPEKSLNWKVMKAFNGYACVTTTKGKGNVYSERYQASAKKVWELVVQHCGEPRKITPGRNEEVKRKIEKYMKKLNSRSWFSWLIQWF